MAGFEPGSRNTWTELPHNLGSIVRVSHKVGLQMRGIELETEFEFEVISIAWKLVPWIINPKTTILLHYSWMETITVLTALMEYVGWRLWKLTACYLFGKYIKNYLN